MALANPEIAVSVALCVTWGNPWTSTDQRIRWAVCRKSEESFLGFWDLDNLGVSLWRVDPLRAGD